MATGSAAVLIALNDALSTADDKALQLLGKELKEYKEKYWRSYANMQNIPMLRKMFECIEEVTELYSPMENH